MSKLRWLMSLRRSALTDTEFRVLVTLASYSDSEMRGARPAVCTLARDCRKSDRTVQRTLAGLRRKGVIRLVAKGGNRYGKGATNVWDICPSAVPAPHPTTVPAGRDQPRRLSTRVTPTEPESYPQGCHPEARKGDTGDTPSIETSIKERRASTSPVRLVSSNPHPRRAHRDRPLAVPVEPLRHAIPADWTPPARDLAAAAAARPDLDMAEEIAKFAAHFAATGAVMADWGARYRKWVLDARAPGNRPGGAVKGVTWCGRCEESTRLVEDARGAYASTMRRCPRCHPLRRDA